MFTQCVKTGYDEGESKEEKKIPEGTLTISPAIIVGNKSIMWVIYNAPTNQI